MNEKSELQHDKARENHKISSLFEIREGGLYSSVHHGQRINDAAPWSPRIRNGEKHKHCWTQELSTDNCEKSTSMDGLLNRVKKNISNLLFLANPSKEIAMIYFFYVHAIKERYLFIFMLSPMCWIMGIYWHIQCIEKIFFSKRSWCHNKNYNIRFTT